jgi:NDP-sugar pyrophosphorylase family protein
MSVTPYLGVILAAGHGSRMGPFGEEMPKPVAPICNKPLLAYQIEHLRALGINEIIVVIGHLGHLITAALGDGSAYGVRIRYVEQTQRLGLAHAVGQLEPHIDRPFVLMLGDIFFEVSDLGRMVRAFEEHRPAAVLATKNEPDPSAVRRNFSVHLRDDGTVRRVIEKPRFVETNLKGCGLYLFDLRIFDAIRRTPRTALRDEYELTDSIQILIDLDYPVCAATVVEWDMNITYIGDLIACCRRQLAAEGRPSLVGSGCELADGVELEETVLGDGVSVSKPTRMERCVVMSGVEIADGGMLADMVITRTARLHAGG